MALGSATLFPQNRTVRTALSSSATREMNVRSLELSERRWTGSWDGVLVLALSQRLSPLGLIFRSQTPTSDKIILVNFRISLPRYIKLIKYYSRHYALSNTALLISFDYELLEL